MIPSFDLDKFLLIASPFNLFLVLATVAVPAFIALRYYQAYQRRLALQHKRAPKKQTLEMTVPSTPHMTALPIKT